MIFFHILETIKKHYHKLSVTKLRYLCPISGTKIQLASPKVKRPFLALVMKLIGLGFRPTEKAHIESKLVMISLCLIDSLAKYSYFS